MKVKTIAVAGILIAVAAAAFAQETQVRVEPIACLPLEGNAPVHVTLAIQGPGSYLVQPVQRGFGLFLLRSGTSQLVPVPANDAPRPQAK